MTPTPSAIAMAQHIFDSFNRCICFNVGDGEQEAWRMIDDATESEKLFYEQACESLRLFISGEHSFRPLDSSSSVPPSLRASVPPPPEAP